MQTNFSQPFFTFWDHLLGTVWTGGDVSARYERAATMAQKKVDAEKTITNTNAGDSSTENLEPYENEIREAKILKQIPSSEILPEVPAGKAQFQAAGSREQVLEDPNGGVTVLNEEAEEEKEARKAIRKSNRRRTASSLTQSDSLRGLRERVTAHGRTGSIIGIERPH
jgi:sphinganine C4-monooxygenase